MISLLLPDVRVDYEPLWNHNGEAIWLEASKFMRSRVTLLSRGLLGNDDLPGVELLHSYYLVFLDILWAPCYWTTVRTNTERALS